MPIESNWICTLRCRRCGARKLAVDPLPEMDELLPARGEAVCGTCDARYPISDHVLDFAWHEDFGRLTMAGRSNLMPLVPQAYENIWRPRSLAWLTGRWFPVEREVVQINQWLRAEPNELIVDLGSSTDLYARGIAKSEPNGKRVVVVAIDLAMGMLKAGHAYARHEGIANIAHVRAPAQKLPFAHATVDALVCGGSLNEFRSIDEVLREARRVCAPNGRMVTMSLLAASSMRGKTVQWIARRSGITFPTLDQFNAALVAAGWRREKQKVLGVVAFTLVRPVESGPK